MLIDRFKAFINILHIIKYSLPCSRIFFHVTWVITVFWDNGALLLISVFWRGSYNLETYINCQWNYVAWKQIYRNIRASVYRKVSIIIGNSSTSMKQEIPRERCRGLARVFHVNSTTWGVCFSSYSIDKLAGGTDIVSLKNFPEKVGLWLATLKLELEWQNWEFGTFPSIPEVSSSTLRSQIWYLYCYCPIYARPSRQTPAKYLNLCHTRFCAYIYTLTAH